MNQGVERNNVARDGCHDVRSDEPRRWNVFNLSNRMNGAYVRDCRWSPASFRPPCIASTSLKDAVNSLLSSIQSLLESVIIQQE